MKYNVIYNIKLYLSAKKHFHIKYERKFYKTIAKEDDICSYDHRPTDWNAQTAAGNFLTTQRLEKESVRSRVFFPFTGPLGTRLGLSQKFGDPSEEVDEKLKMIK